MTKHRFIMELMELKNLVEKMGNYEDLVVQASLQMWDTIRNDGIIYVIGNGGSAADANHFTGEILGRFRKERKGLGAISLTADNATITAIANDYGYEWIFQRQLEGVFNPEKDLLFTMSTSGNSENIINAVQHVHEMGGKTINLLGKGGGKMMQFDTGINIVVPSQQSARIQEIHKFLLHFFAGVIEEEYLKMKGL